MINTRNVTVKSVCQLWLINCAVCIDYLLSPFASREPLAVVLIITGFIQYTTSCFNQRKFQLFSLYLNRIYGKGTKFQYQLGYIGARSHSPNYYYRTLNCCTCSSNWTNRIFIKCKSFLQCMSSHSFIKHITTYAVKTNVNI